MLGHLLARVRHGGLPPGVRHMASSGEFVPAAVTHSWFQQQCLGLGELLLLHPLAALLF